MRELERSQQEDVLPLSLINIIGKIPVKGHARNYN